MTTFETWLKRDGDRHNSTTTVKTWTDADNPSVEYAIRRRDMRDMDSFYCGYVAFHQPMFIDRSYTWLESDVEVHGGLTFAEYFDDLVQVYGFDCAHAWDENNPQLKDLDWLTAECEHMGKQILKIKAEQS